MLFFFFFLNHLFSKQQIFYFLTLAIHQKLDDVNIATTNAKVGTMYLYYSTAFTYSSPID